MPNIGFVLTSGQAESSCSSSAHHRCISLSILKSLGRSTVSQNAGLAAATIQVYHRPFRPLSTNYIVRFMRVNLFLEHLLSVEAETRNLLAPGDRSFERGLKQELSKILEEAEFYFGPRDTSYELREPLITECFTARVVVYPFRFARIYLSNDSKIDPQMASYELSHEAIHVLGPSFAVAPTMLEEGLATYFSLRYVNRVHGLGWQNTSDPKYDAALRGVNTLLAKNEFLIKELRTRQPVISKIDEQLLVEVAGVEHNLAKLLSADFHTYGSKPDPLTEYATQGAQRVITSLRSIWD